MRGWIKIDYELMPNAMCFSVKSSTFSGMSRIEIENELRDLIKADMEANLFGVPRKIEPLLDEIEEAVAEDARAYAELEAELAGEG